MKRPPCYVVCFLRHREGHGLGKLRSDVAYHCNAIRNYGLRIAIEDDQNMKIDEMTVMTAHDTKKCTFSRDEASLRTGPHATSEIFLSVINRVRNGLYCATCDTYGV